MGQKPEHCAQEQVPTGARVDVAQVQAEAENRDPAGIQGVHEQVRRHTREKRDNVRHVRRDHLPC